MLQWEKRNPTYLLCCNISQTRQGLQPLCEYCGLYSSENLAGCRVCRGNERLSWNGGGRGRDEALRFTTFATYSLQSLLPTLFIEAVLKVLHNLKSNTGVAVYGKVVESEYETVVLS
jgi:hypothetical protein